MQGFLKSQFIYFYFLVWFKIIKVIKSSGHSRWLWIQITSSDHQNKGKEISFIHNWVFLKNPKEDFSVLTKITRFVVLVTWSFWLHIRKSWQHSCSFTFCIWDYERFVYVTGWGPPIMSDENSYLSPLRSTPMWQQKIALQSGLYIHGCGGLTVCTEVDLFTWGTWASLDFGTHWGLGPHLCGYQGATGFTQPTLLLHRIWRNNSPSPFKNLLFPIKVW